MACWSCSTDRFRSVSRAMAKAAGAKWRSLGAGAVESRWTLRAEICERCPLRVVHGNTSYCGKPFLQKIERDPGVDGCGCPTVAKAKAPGEHCPLNSRHLPVSEGVPCMCKWCVATNTVNTI